MKKPRIVVVVKRSAYKTLQSRRSDPAIAKLLADPDRMADKLLAAHREHEQTVREVLRALDELGVDYEVARSRWQKLGVRGARFVITVGGDGTLIIASHQIGGRTPVLGINSTPSTSVGFFCSLRPGQCKSGIARALDGEVPVVELARMRVRINDRVVSKRVLNDALFCHSSPAATSRYVVEFDGAAERHKSSGFWIGPAAGSTAAQHSAGGQILPLDSKALQFVVREPFAYAGPLRFARVLVPNGERLLVRSKMVDGKLFLDGTDIEFDVSMGTRIEFSRSDDSLVVFGALPR